jgi:uncharacterized membrane protein (UPF0127 family)
MGRGRRPVAVLLAALVLAGACSRSSGSSDGEKIRPLPPEPAGGFDPPVTVIFDGAPELRVEVATRPDQWARGLMQRTSVPDGTGMLFLFPAPQSTGFWMFGTLVPLSIAYINDDRVVATAEMVPCTSRSGVCPPYPPGASYTAAVEAPAGFFPKHGVVGGTRLRVIGATLAPK